MCSGWLRSTVCSGPSRKATTSPYSCWRRHKKPNMSREKARTRAPGTRARGPGGDGVDTIQSPSMEVLHVFMVWVTTREETSGDPPQRINAVDASLLCHGTARCVVHAG